MNYDQDSPLRPQEGHRTLQTLLAPRSLKMNTSRYRPNSVRAMRFDGTTIGAQTAIDWLTEIAPELTVRPRVEYIGWEDPTGHVELEIRGHDDQCSTGDWLVLDRFPSRYRLRVMSDHDFHQQFEKEPD